MSSSRLDPQSSFETVRGRSLGTNVRDVIALIIFTIGAVMSSGIQALGATFIDPLFALADAGVAFVEGVFANPLGALAGAWEFALFSVTQGEWAFFGPGTPLVIFGVFLATLSMYLVWADRFNIDLPTVGDIPFVGLDESGADDEQ